MHDYLPLVFTDKFIYHDFSIVLKIILKKLYISIPYVHISLLFWCLCMWPYVVLKHVFRLQEPKAEAENEASDGIGRVDEGVEEFFTKKIIPDYALWVSHRLSSYTLTRC